jgi:DNA-binding SARP family transcriptional activator
MIEFRTLGPLELRWQYGPELVAVLKQPKRIALLAYLALGNGGGLVRRDRLLALFWSDVEDSRARASLRQALHSLRKDTDNALTLTRSAAEVRLNPDVIWCDAAAFDAAVARDALDDAVELYRGPFLESFYLRGCPDFESWTHTVRARLTVSHTRCRERLAERALEAGEYANAITHLRALIGYDPCNSPAVCTLMTALAESGDPVAAVRVAEAHSEMVLRDYEAVPSPEVIALADRLRRQPQPRSLTDAHAEANGQAGRSPAVHEAAPHYESPTADPPARQLRRRGVFAAIAAVTLIFTVTMIAPLRNGASDPTIEIHPNLVFVAPFRISAPDSTLHYLREGMVDLLYRSLVAGEGGPTAVDPTSAIGAWERAGGDGRGLSLADALELARQVGAGQLLLGSIVGTQSGFNISAELRHVTDGELIASTSIAATETEFHWLADSLMLRLVGTQVQPDRLGLTDSWPAMQAFLTGRAAGRKGMLLEALQSYDRALALDSTFSLAAFEMRRTCNAFGHPSPFACYQWERVRFYSWDNLPARERTIRESSRSTNKIVDRRPLAEKGARLHPGSAEAWNRLAGSWLRHESYFRPDSVWIPPALAAMDRALALEPNHPGYLGHAIQIAVYAGHTDRLVRYRDRYINVVDSTDLARPFSLWLAANGLNDPEAVRAVLRGRWRLKSGRWLTPSLIESSTRRSCSDFPTMRCGSWNAGRVKGQPSIAPRKWGGL